MFIGLREYGHDEITVERAGLSILKTLLFVRAT